MRVLSLAADRLAAIPFPESRDHHHGRAQPAAAHRGPDLGPFAENIVASLPPNCTTIIVNGLAYQNCGGTYYQPRYSGTTVTYIVVARP